MNIGNLTLEMHKLSATSRPTMEESGNDFFIVSDTGTLDYSIAKWYNKGDKVHLALKPDSAQSRLSAGKPEDKFMNAIFGTLDKVVTVKDDGFYVILPDSSLSDNKDCVEWLARCDDEHQETYWSRLPDELDWITK